MKLTFRIVTALALLSLTTTAGELRRDLVPSDASWIAHYDHQALTRSVLFRTAQPEEPEATPADPAPGAEGDRRPVPAGESEIDQLFAQTGFDPLVDVRSVTVFGTGGVENEALALIDLTAVGVKTIDALQAQMEQRTVDEGGVPLTSWNDPDSGETIAYSYLHSSGGDANLVLCGESRVEVARCAKVMRGDGASLAQRSENGLTATPGPDAILYLETGEYLPGLDGIDEISLVTRMARGLRFELGESAGQLYGNLIVHTPSAEQALRASQVLQGISALAILAAGESEEGQMLAELASVLRFETSGSDLVISFVYDSEELVELSGFEVPELGAGLPLPR
jgi:hypothetical protein